MVVIPTLTEVEGEESAVPDAAANLDVWPAVPPFDFPDATTTEGASPLRSLQGWEPRACSAALHDLRIAVRAVYPFA